MYLDEYLRIVQYVKDLIANYPEDGSKEDRRAYMSNLDQCLRRPWVVDPILKDLEGRGLVLTGGFGEYVVRRWRGSYMLFNGHIRDGAHPAVVSRSEELDWALHWTFFDDSYYSGRTFKAIERVVEFLDDVVVVYNGYKEWSPSVNGIYSWFMVNG